MLKRWQYRVDVSAVDGRVVEMQFFDTRLAAALFMVLRRFMGWDVAVRGEYWS